MAEPQAARRSPPAARWLVLLWTLAVGCALYARRDEPGYLVTLAGAGDPILRGALAADERRSPYATAGQVRWREQLAGSPAPAASPGALAWTFLASHSGVVAPGERVFTPPIEQLLYAGNYLWFPTRLEVGPASGRPLADADALRREALRATPGAIPARDLAGLGYSWAIRFDGRRLELVDLDPR
jgi:hypothetical protein